MFTSFEVKFQLVDTNENHFFKQNAEVHTLHTIRSL